MDDPSRWPCDETRPFVVIDGDTVNPARKQWIVDQGKEILDHIIHPEDDEDEEGEDDGVTQEDADEDGGVRKL